MPHTEWTMILHPPCRTGRSPIRGGNEDNESAWMWSSNLMKAGRLSCSWVSDKWVVHVDDVFMAECTLAYEALQSAQIMFKARRALKYG